MESGGGKSTSRKIDDVFMKTCIQIFHNLNLIRDITTLHDSDGVSVPSSFTSLYLRVIVVFADTP